MKRWIFAALVCSSGCITKGDFSANSLLTDIEFTLPGSRVGWLLPGAVHADWRDKEGRSLHVVAIDTQRSGIVIRAALAHDRFRGRLEPLDKLSSRKGAVAAISMGYPDRPGFVTGGLTVLDRSVQLAPNPPKRPSIVIGRDYTFKIGTFHPDLNPDLDYSEVLSGIWSVGEGYAKAPVSTRPWTLICRSTLRNALLWIYAPDAGPPEAIAKRFKCVESFVAAIDARAGLVVKGRNTATAAGLRRPVGDAGAALLLMK